MRDGKTKVSQGTGERGKNAFRWESRGRTAFFSIFRVKFRVCCGFCLFVVVLVALKELFPLRCLQQLADVVPNSCLSLLTVTNGLARAGRNALKKKEVASPCQAAHAAQYLRKSSAVAGQEKSQFNLGLPLPKPLQVTVSVPLAENLPDSPPAFGVPGGDANARSRSGRRSGGTESPPGLHHSWVWGCLCGRCPGSTGTTQAHRNTRVTAPEPSPPRTLAAHAGSSAGLRAGGSTLGRGDARLLKLPLHTLRSGGGSTFPRKPRPHPAGPQPRGCPAAADRPPSPSPEGAEAARAPSGTGPRAPSAPAPPPPRRGVPADPPPLRGPGRALTSWGPPSVAPPVWRRSVGLQRPLPPPPPSLPPRPQKRCPARRRGRRLGARGIPAGAGPGRGGAGPREVACATRGSSGAQATRVQVVTTLPPGWVRAPGRREARTGRGRRGGRVFVASRAGARTAHESRGEAVAARGGGAVYTARVVRGERVCGRAGVYSTLPSAASAY